MEDYMVRGIAAGGQIRAFAAYTRNTVETARLKHNTSPLVTAALGRLLTAGAIMGSMMKDEKDVLTLQIQGSGPIKLLLVSADSNGNVKGYPGVPDVVLPANAKGKLDVAGGLGVGILTVIKDIGLKEPYSGTCELVSGEIAEDLTYYFASSEQTPSSVGLGVLMTKENTVDTAGGFIIQVMPDATDETITAIENKLATINSVTGMLKDGMTPEDIINDILEGLEPEILDRMPVSFKCGCSKEKVENAIVLMGKDEVQKIIDDGKDIEVNCHFCNTTYKFGIDELKAACEKVFN